MTPVPINKIASVEICPPDGDGVGDGVGDGGNGGDGGVLEEDKDCKEARKVRS